MLDGLQFGVNAGTKEAMKVNCVQTYCTSVGTVISDSKELCSFGIAVEDIFYKRIASPIMIDLTR